MALPLPQPLDLFVVLMNVSWIPSLLLRTTFILEIAIIAFSSARHQLPVHAFPMMATRLLLIHSEWRSTFFLKLFKWTAHSLRKEQNSATSKSSKREKIATAPTLWENDEDRN
jgi:hypothetical protein